MAALQHSIPAASRPLTDLEAVAELKRLFARISTPRLGLLAELAIDTMDGRDGDSDYEPEPLEDNHDGEPDDDGI